MPNTREKLIELVTAYFGVDPSYYGIEAQHFVDHLIANGVTVPEWISVKDRLPEDVYGKGRDKIAVLVCTKSGNVSQCVRCADCALIADERFSRVEWIKNGKFYWSKGKNVTHWMPLPEPPKGE